MRDVAVVGFAQRQMKEFDGSPTCVELLVPLFAECYEQTGWTRQDVGFWCSGSSDYLAGRSFSFVQAVDAIGVIPPVNESHVEMDLAWAMYEAWIKIQTGEVDTALVYAFGKSSAGVLRRTLSLQLDPYTMTPLWPDTVSLAGLQAREGIDAGLWDERAMAEVANRSLTDAEKNEYAVRKGGSSVEELLARPVYADPLRKHDCAPVTDGAAALVLAAGDRARDVADRPAWITSLTHYVDPMSMGTRDLKRSPSVQRAGAAARPGRRRGGRAARAVQPPGADPPHRAGPGRRCPDQPVGWGADQQPDVLRRRHPHRRGREADLVWHRLEDAGPRHFRAGAAAEPRVRAVQRRDRRLMGKQPAAVIGVGQTHHRAKREDVSMPGLLREAIDRALDDAQLTLDEIDAIVVGKAPDLFEGVMMPELFLADSIGAAGKPLLRVHTAGSVGGSTAIVASSLVQAGVHKKVLTVAYEKQSESNAMWALSVPIPFNMPVHAGAGGYFAPHVRSYIRRSEAPNHIGAIVAAKDRQNALKNPYAHLKNPDTTVESVLASQMLWDPIRYDETCPSSDGACALVIVAEDEAARSSNPAWIHGTVMRSEATSAAERDQVNPQASRDAAAALWKQAGITSPIDEIDMAEIYVPFSWFEPMWLESLGFADANGGGWRLTESGATAMDGRLPVNCSGGVLSSNPIGASGMLRFGEAALQVRGAAGEHQVDGARKALGHAYGGGSQFFAMWVVGSEKPTN